MNRTLPQAISVLVVDDYRDAAESFAALLSCWGYDPLVVHDGAEALRMAALHRPSIVLLDLMLPDMDGFEVARRLRRDLNLGHALLVSISGHAQAVCRRAALAAGCDHHLVKPVDPQELRRLLASCEPVRERPPTEEIVL